MPSVFFSYSHKDEKLRDRLETQLAMLKRQGVIEMWHDRRIGAGQNIHQAISSHITIDDIILLLVSPDFIASDYCYDVEMQQAMERHEKGEAVVIPVILRPCEWQHSPFGTLKAVPLDGKPITQWADIDDAFLQVAKAIREAAGRKIPAVVASETSKTATNLVFAPAPTANPRSSKLRLAKNFTQKDKDQFKLDTFEYIARYFENSLNELGERNPGFEGVFRRVDANRFFATIYKNGKDVARGTVFVGGDNWSGGISYAQGEVISSSSMNESLNVHADDQTLYLTSMGMVSFGMHRNRRLTQEGASELFWEILISPLQGSAR